jgi:hypothetical protein
MTTNDGRCPQGPVLDSITRRMHTTEAKENGAKRRTHLLGCEARIKRGISSGRLLSATSNMSSGQIPEPCLIPAQHRRRVVHYVLASRVRTSDHIWSLFGGGM